MFSADWVDFQEPAVVGGIEALQTGHALIKSICIIKPRSLCRRFGMNEQTFSMSDKMVEAWLKMAVLKGHLCSKIDFLYS